MLPFFAPLYGWYSPAGRVGLLQPEKHPPNFSMIPLLVTLAAVTRVARRFFLPKGMHSFFQCMILSSQHLVQPGLPQDAVHLQHIVQSAVIKQKGHVAHGKGAQGNSQRRGAHLL